MTPLRDKFIKARDAYEQTRYPGNLALDVLPGASASKGPKWVMAIAAAVAVMAGSVYLATRSGDASKPAQDVAVKDTSPDVGPALPELAPMPVTPDVAVVTNEQATEDENFTLVPTLESLADASQEGPSGPMNLTLSVPDAPMLFSLSALSEQTSVESNQDETESENRS